MIKNFDEFTSEKNQIDESRITKSSIKNEKDQMLWQATSLSNKARRLRREGKTKESEELLKQVAELKEKAKNWKPEPTMVEQEVEIFDIIIWRSSMWSGSGRPRTIYTGCIRDILCDPDTFEFLNRYLSKEEKEEYLTLVADVKGSKYAWCGPAEATINTRDTYYPDPMQYTMANGLHRMLGEAYSHKSVGQTICILNHNRTKRIIEVQVENPRYWRYKGDRAWNVMPSKKDWGI